VRWDKFTLTVNITEPILLQHLTGHSVSRFHCVRRQAEPVICSSNCLLQM